MQEWKIKGRIFTEQAQCPTLLELDDRWRIYFSQRDSEGKSHLFYIDVESGQPEHLLSNKQRPEPQLTLGPPGAFDHYGIMPSSIIKHRDLVYLYYVGWGRRKDVPYHNLAGLAYSDNNGCSFKKFAGPILTPTFSEPYFNGTSCVIKEKNLWLNWYMSCTTWAPIGPHRKLEPRYHLKLAKSEDGIDWKQDNTVAIDYKDYKEGGISKATVIKADQTYKMWYSYRKWRLDYRNTTEAAYKIGYASSNDGLVWSRNDEVVQLPKTEWDSIMQCYPCVVKHQNKLYMFYNGNGFGQTGIGYATLVS